MKHEQSNKINKSVERRGDLVETAKHGSSSLKANRSEVFEDSKHEYNIEEIRNKLEQISTKVEKVSNLPQEVTQESPKYISKTLKDLRYKSTLKETEKQLNTLERYASRVINNRVVDKYSEIGAKTIARPMGILTGTLCAIIGGTVIYIMAKKIGFSLPSTVLIFLYLLGFIIGLLVDFVLSLKHKRPRY
ncbi:hypothetical protein KBB76_01165 [Candidatus Saccharibacteria bacterium]|jgi:archaellum component FlaC|nr:hypothetical protein [Candidatus Saccharibacteria bacterium]HOR23154.1 hypothetical protein [Candidatus Saccharibacteria bacterium]